MNYDELIARLTAYERVDAEWLGMTDRREILKALKEAAAALRDLVRERGEMQAMLLQFIEYVEQDTEWPDIVAEGRAFLDERRIDTARGEPHYKPCCANEDRTMNGGCRNCGDPCL